MADVLYVSKMKDMFDKFIVIDGPDGSGKSTQLEKTWDHLMNDTYNIGQGDDVKERLKWFYSKEKAEKRAVRLSFPEYDKPTGDLVLKMLHGEFGSDTKNLNSYFTSAMYAIDRYQAMQRVFKEMPDKVGIGNNYTVCLSARYTISNLVHQGARLRSLTEFMDYMNWLFDYEYIKLGLPVPDLNIYLVTPPDVSLKSIIERQEQTGEKQDINETEDYLYEVYEHINVLKRMNVIPGGKYIDVMDYTDRNHPRRKTVDEVNAEIMSYISSIWHKQRGVLYT